MREGNDSYMGFHMDNNIRFNNFQVFSSVQCASGFPWPWGDATTLVI